MQLITARMREEVSKLRNEMIEMKSENIVHESRNTSGSSRRIGMKESKPRHKLFNAARSSGEVKENAASGSEIKESSSVKPVERESLNEDVKASKRID